MALEDCDRHQTFNAGDPCVNGCHDYVYYEPATKMVEFFLGCVHPSRIEEALRSQPHDPFNGLLLDQALTKALESLTSEEDGPWHVPVP